MRTKLQFAGWFLALLLIPAGAATAVAQRPPTAREPRPAPQRQPRAQQWRQQRQVQRQQQRLDRPLSGPQNTGNWPGANRPGPAARPGGPGQTSFGRGAGAGPAASGAFGNNVPPRFLDRLQSMPPQAQERFLRNNQAFQSMSPERQQQIRSRLQQWNRLTPQQQDRLRQNAMIWQHMTPQQQQHIRGDILPKWRQLPPDRRQAIQRRLSVLQNMPDAAREQRLNSPQFMRGLSPEDQAMLRDLSHMRVAGSPEPPGQ